MATTLAHIVQRRKTAAAWTSSNEVLLGQEFGVESDTNKFKIGDGTTPWTSLGYQAGSAASLAATYVPVLNPLAFGAAGDGTTDDTAAVQAAANALTPGATLQFTKPHKITSTVTVANKDRFTIDGGLALLSFAGTATSASGVITALALTGCTRFRIRRVRLDIATQTQQYSGITVSTSNRGRITENHVTNARWAGISVYDSPAATSYDIAITHNTVEGCRYEIVTNGKQIRIQDNTVADYWLSSSEASVAWTSASNYYDGIILSTGATECTVSGNTIIETGQSGIYSGLITNCNITGNTIVRAQNKGIDIGPGSGAPSGLTVTGNTLVDCATGNIHFYNVIDSTITGNTCTLTAATYFGSVINQPGIILNAQCLRNVIAGNKITQAGAAAAIFINQSGSAGSGNIVAANAFNATTNYSLSTTANTVITGLSLGDVQVFTASGTWTKPANITTVTPYIVSGGAGGGSGARGASSTVRSGGGGGGGGGVTMMPLRAADLAATVTVTVGAGGAGAVSVTTDSTSGTAGSAGGLSGFGGTTYGLRTGGNSGGGGGSTAAATAGSGGGGTIAAASGGASSGTGGAGLGGQTFGTGGGGSGGGITSANVTSAGGSGGSTLLGNAVNGGTAGTQDGGNGGNGGTGASSLAMPVSAPGGGGGGGGSSSTTAGGNGGNGGSYGGGGGGGGASLNGNASGAGGSGGAGIVIVFSS